jgi:hypothetical protein
MGLVKRFKRWRSLGGVTFDEAPTSLSAAARIDAAEYELQAIIRDVSGVRLPDLGLSSAGSARKY